MPQKALRLQHVLCVVLLGMLSASPAFAASKTYAWDPPRMADGALIPAAANIQYRLHYGPTSRGTAQRDTFVYPNQSPLTASTTATMTIPGPIRICASVTAVAAADYSWTVSGTTYAIAAGESLYSNEACADYPADPIPVPPPGNFRTVP